MASSTKSSFTFKYVDSAETIAIGATLPAVCIAVVSLRFYARLQSSVRLGIDDWLIVGGLICFIGMGICLIYGKAKCLLLHFPLAHLTAGAAVGAMGYPTPLPPSDASEEEQLQFNPPSTELIGKLQFAFQLLMVICYGFVKISIVCFYRRIFVPWKKTLFEITTTVVNVVMFLWSLTFILIIIFDCGAHIFANWGSPAAQEAYCAAIGHTSEEGLAGSDLILDVVLIILPIPSIWALHMTRIRKLQVTFIMMLGLSSLAASIARLVLYVQLIQAAIAMEAVDQNQVLTLSMYWSALEVGLAVIAACLPSLSSLFTMTSLQSAVRSVRSVLSLHSSHDSPKNSIQNPPNPYTDLEHNSSLSSRTGFMKPRTYTGPLEYDLQDFELANQQKPAVVP